MHGSKQNNVKVAVTVVGLRHRRCHPRFSRTRKASRKQLSLLALQAAQARQWCCHCCCCCCSAPLLPLQYQADAWVTTPSC